MLGDDVIPYVGRGREENSHAGVFGDGDDLGDGFGDDELSFDFGTRASCSVNIRKSPHSNLNIVKRINISY